MDSARSETIDSAVAMDLCQEALELSLEKHFKEGEILSYSTMAQIMINSSDFSKAIEYASKALILFEDNKPLDLNPAILHHRLASGLEGLGAYSTAIKHRVLQLKHKADFNDQTYYLQHGIALLYSRIDKTDSALFYYDLALESALDLHDNQIISNAYNNLGFTYLLKKDTINAIQYFELGLTVIDSTSDLSDREKLMRAVIIGNLGVCYTDPKEQMELVSQSLDGIRKHGSEQEVFLALCRASEVRLYHNDMLATKAFLGEADSLYNSVKTINGEVRLRYLNAKLLYYIKVDEEANAIEVLSTVEHFQDSLYGKKAKNELLQRVSNYELNRINHNLNLERVLHDKSRLELEKSENESRIYRLNNIILLVSGVFVVLILLVVLIKVRGDNRRKREAEELKHELLRAENRLQAERLHQSILSVQRKEEFSSAIIEQLSDLKSIDKRELNELKFYIRNEMSIDESMTDMDEYMNQYSTEFFAKLTIDFPKLTDNDHRFIALLGLGLSSKQVATIKNITPESVKIARNRLRKKLNLETGSDLQEFINNYISIK